MSFETRQMENGEIHSPEKELFFNRERRHIEAAEVLNERLDELGINSEKKELERLDPSFAKKLPDYIEDYYDSYPETKGYLTSIRADRLPEGVMARTGPYLNENGEYAGAQLVLNNAFWSKRNHELQIVDMESDLNWRSERWISGVGSRGVIVHELAHVQAMKINAEDAGLQIGENNQGKYEGLQKRYNHNSKIITLCNDAMMDLNISPRNIGRELSTYASSDFGELFAESMSQYETRKHPSRLSTEIHDRYLKLVEERNNQAEEREAV